MKILLQEYQGILLSTLIGLIAYFSVDYFGISMGSILLALLLGMLLGNFLVLPFTFQSGISFTSGKLLELSILFLAFSINYKHIAMLGTFSFSIIAVVVFLMLLITYFLANRINCPTSSGWLIGFGTTICGSSAIAALAPTIAKNKDDVAISMAVVNLFGSLGMIVLPILFRSFDLSNAQMGFLLGGGLHSVGNVAGAAFAINDDVGVAAITMKLARVAMLSPALIFFNYLVNRKNVSNWKQHFKLPWYLWSFILITILISFIHLPKPFLEAMEIIGKIILTIAMAAIGLKVSFRQLLTSGKRGVGFGLIIFLIMLLFLSGGILLIES
ncbi:MAG: putative sulfate exporter family transporter [Ferruginibacter sp.]